MPIAPHPTRRLTILSLGVLSCLWGAWVSAAEGLSQVLAGHSAMTERLDEAAQAVRLSPTNPEAHYVRATLLSAREDLSAATEEYEQAVALRPKDYALWLELGGARDQSGDPEGAIDAFRQAAHLAPFYAQPHWQLGNTLYRSGRIDEAVQELRLAAGSNPKLNSQALGMVWPAKGGDAQAIEQAISPRTPSTHLALARFLVKHGKIKEAMQHYRAAGGLSKDQQHELVRDLLASGSFVEAFEVWSASDQTKRPDGLGHLVSGGFEDPIALNDPGFGWQLADNKQAVHLALDPSRPRDGNYSLRVDWSGESDASTPVISQLVLVKPKTRYRLSFAARSQELLTIGLPYVMVVDAGDETKAVLMKSETLPQGTSEWKDYLAEFTTAETTSAVTISIRRVSCATPQCAAFGHVWFDNFSLVRL